MRLYRIGMESWKKTLAISWIIIFIHGIGLQMFIPFLPLYLKELGVTDPRSQSTLSGIIIGATPFFSGLLAPFWGTISDKYGRKPLLLRTTFGISVITLLMYFATNVYQLLALRILQGICGGMLPAFTALVAFYLPKEKLGQGLGTLQSAIFSGTILGPFIGGMLSDYIGYANVLLGVSVLTLMAGVATFLFIEEPKRDQAKPRATVIHNLKLVIASPNLRIVAIAIFFIQFSLFIVQPILPLFIVSLPGSNNSATMVGLVFAATGCSTLLFASYWGHVGDKKGHMKILSQSLLFTGCAFIPQALVTSAYQLLPLRLIMGFFTAGIVPSTQTMIVKNTKDSQRGGVLGVTHSVNACGNAMGPLVGGVTGAVLGYRSVILLTAAMLIILWSLLRGFSKRTDDAHAGR